MYEEFARFYDQIEGEVPASFARWITRRLEAYRVNVTSVLELGCGTGAVLAALPSTWVKTGVDRSVAMLDQARAKGVAATFVHADLTTVAADRTHDLVIMVFDTVNHLVDPDDWPRAFTVARAHLPTGGMFLFDVHTLGRLRLIAAGQPMVRDLGDDTVIIDVVAGAGDRYRWDIRIFERDGDGYRRRQDTIHEIGLPLARIRTMLAGAGFRVLEVLDPAGRRAHDDSARAFFTCRALP